MSGFVSTELLMDARALVAHLSSMGSDEVRKVMEAACEFYGFALHCDEDVQFRLNAKSTVFCPEIWTWNPDGTVKMERRALSEWPQWAEEQRDQWYGKEELVHQVQYTQGGEWYNVSANAYNNYSKPGFTGCYAKRRIVVLPS